MKQSIFQCTVVVALCAASTAHQQEQQQQQQQQPLKERWSISRPTVVYENNDLTTLALQYDIGAFPQPENVQFQLMWGDDCETLFLGQDNDYLHAALVFDNEQAPKSRSSGTRSVTMQFQVQQDETDSPLFSKTNDDKTILQFCNRLSLHTTTGTMVNWLDTQLTVHLLSSVVQPKAVEEPSKSNVQPEPVVWTIASSSVESERRLRPSR
jgi:hypothetical protein